MKPVSFITSRMRAKGTGGNVFQTSEESAHLIRRFAGMRFSVLASAAGSMESDAIKSLRLIILTIIATGFYAPLKCRRRNSGHNAQCSYGQPRFD